MSIDDVSEAVLRSHDVWVPTDSRFQKRCRLQQALWREAQGIPMGKTSKGDPLGSRIEMPRASTLLENFLTPIIRDVVRAEVNDPVQSAGKLFGKPRIYDNLLSSQPLCFNLFAELSVDVAIATVVFQRLAPQRGIADVKAIRFEHSPGRGDDRYTGDRSAFDVFVEYVSTKGQRGFLGIEVKYHEALADKAAEHRARYDELATACGWWKDDHREALRRKPLQQMWRDHLLAASLIVNRDFDEGAFIFLAPRENRACSSAVGAFEKCIARPDVFASWTLEDVIDHLGEVNRTTADVIRARYVLPKEDPATVSTRTR